MTLAGEPTARRRRRGPAAAEVAPEALRPPGRRILGNFLALSAARPLTWLSTIGLTILLPRYLGDVNLGQDQLRLRLRRLVRLARQLRDRHVSGEGGRPAPGRAPTIVLNALMLRVALALGSAWSPRSWPSLLGYDRLTRHLVYLLTAHMLLTVFAGVLIGALQGVQQLRVVALVDAVDEGRSSSGWWPVVLVRGHGPIGVAVAYIVGDLFAVGWLLLAVRRRIGFAGPVAVATWRTILVAGCRSWSGRPRCSPTPGST